MSERKRWGGIWLGDNERDRVIAAWLDEKAADPTFNVSGLVKDYLYLLATGKAPTDHTVQALADLQTELANLRRALAAGAHLAGGQTAGELAGEDEAAEVIRRLTELPD